MFDIAFSSQRSILSPQKELELVTFYLENAHKIQDKEIALALCNHAKSALSRIKRAVRKTLTTPLSAEGQALYDGFVDAYIEHAKLMESLGYVEIAEASYKAAEKWGRMRPAKDSTPAVFSVKNTAGHDLAQIPNDIFPDDMRQPVVKCTLPDADDRIGDTSQLAYCIGLLQVTLTPDEIFEADVETWVKSTEKNADEKERLKTMATDLIREFTRDELKDANAVAEVVRLGPVLERSDFQHLLNLFAGGIEQSSLLDVHSLEGLAQIIQGASPGCLDADDLVTILRILNTRLQDTHKQSPAHIYRLTLAVSNVLDAMADSKVTGLKRVELHEPLSAYLNELKGSSDPYLVYQAAYAFQALQCVPDNESPWQAAMRRTGTVLKGVSGLVSAVKGFDVNGFIDGLGHLQEGLGEVIKVAMIGYDGVSALVESGQGLLESLKSGLSFSQKRRWYTALRGTDTLLRDGQLAKFKVLVCEAPCRNDLAFQLGVCQRLGDLAANPLWDDESRQGAVAFLGEIYRNDAVWGQQAFVKQWIVHILLHLNSTFGSAMPGVESLLQELKSNGDQTKRALYQGCKEEVQSSYPFKFAPQTPSSPSLLDRVQNKPDVETDLRRLKKQRMKERDIEISVYIPPQAKANLLASDDNLFDLEKYVEGFLSSEQHKVMLLLGDSGAGKSTFNWSVEYDLWGRYKAKGRIPLYINLPAIDKPEQDLVGKHLRRNDFTEPQIRELKDHREFILICDGYDESQQMNNLYVSNQLNKPGQWRAQMIVSCRSEYLPSDYRDRFQPMDRNHSAPVDRFREAVIAPFSAAQIKDYISQYVLASKPLWRMKDYLDALDHIPNLQDLVKNPFMLTLALDVLPRMVDPGQDLSVAHITRVALYDQFMDQWLERGKKRLMEKKDLSHQEKKAFQKVSDYGFTQNGIDFLKRLAAAIYKEQAGHPVVEYSHLRNEDAWKEAFFGQDDAIEILREACPLTRSGNQYRFIHRSLLEYCMARTIFEPQEGKGITSQPPNLVRRKSLDSILSFEDPVEPEDESVSVQISVVDHPLSWRSFVGELSILQFLAERVQQEPIFKQQLIAMIENSKVDKEARKAAANAISILVRAGVRFNGVDLKGIQIPGADLSGGEFDSAQLQDADLRKVNLRSIWLRQANLSNANMSGSQFGEWPYLEEAGTVLSCAYSPDGKACAVGVGVENGTVSVYDTTTWTKINTLHGHTDFVRSVAYSPSGDHIASGSWDKTIRLWDAQTGVSGLILNGHTDVVISVIYSPSGHQIASGGGDKVVRLWDAQTGAPGLILEGHARHVRSVAYSPSGHQIVSASDDLTVRLWDAQTGAPGLIFSGHTRYVSCVVYSPDGHQIASGSDDMTVRLWDAQTGSPGPILSGHGGGIHCVAYSPSGHQIASGGTDKSVRLWDAETGAPGPILSGHSSWVNSVVYSPSGHQIASGSRDETLRLWDAHSGAVSPILSHHTEFVNSLGYSPSGHQIVSGSKDMTIRLWDAQTGAPGSILRGHTSDVRGVAYSPIGHQIASGGWDKTVRLWDPETGTPGLILSGHAGVIECVTYSPSGHQIASGGGDKVVRLWDAQTGASGLILSGHTDMVACVTYSPSGHQIASGSWDETVRLWDAQTGTPGPILSGHTHNLKGVAYSPSGHQVASASDDKTVRLWDTQTGAPGLIFDGHTDNVWCVAYSPSGRQIVSGSRDNTVQLWDVDSGQSLVVLEDVHGVIRTLAWHVTLNDTYLATGCGNSFRTWKLIQEEDHHQVQLHWTLKRDVLLMSSASIKNAKGLSKVNVQLLKQRGAVGEPIPPLTFRGAGRKLIGMASMASKLKALSVSKQKIEHDSQSRDLSQVEE